jgi:hypothetical protein
MAMTSGCQTIDVLTFKEDPRSGVLGEAVTSLRIVDRNTELNSSEMAGLTSGFPKLVDELRSCHATSEPGGKAAILAPLAAAAAAYAIETAVTAASEAIQARVDALKQASIQGYSGVLILDDAKTLGVGHPGKIEQCLLLVRRIKKPRGQQGSEAAAAFLIGVVPRGKSSTTSATAVVFTPLYVHVVQSAAVTRSGEPIDAAVALSVVAIVPGKSGPERREVSLGAFKLAKLEFGTSKTWEKEPHPGTGLMALPPSTSAALELRIAVVETGSALPNFDKAKAEIQAVRDALGPAVKELVVKASPAAE